MELEKKLELMKKYDFSQHSQYTGRNKAWIGVISAIKLSVNTIFNHNLSKDNLEESKDIIFCGYGYLRSKYDSIDFSELDKTDEDFSTLFKTKDALSKLGRSINHFLSNPVNQNYSALSKVIQDLIDANKPSYRERIARLEDQL